MQAVPLKQGSNIDVLSPLKGYIKKKGGLKGKESTVASLEAFSKQRNVIVNITDAAGANTISDYKWYYSYLLVIGKKFPLSGKGGLSMPWTWTDSYKRSKVKGNDVIFEKACVLYNIGALYTHKALDAINVEELDIGRCEACIDNLSFAALCFHMLDVEYSAALLSMPHTDDLSSPVLKTLKALCLAQAQHAYFLKAKLSNMSNRAYAALEMCCSELYKDVFDLASASNGYFPKGLVKHFQLQSLLSLLGALHYQGQSYMENPEANAGNLYRYGELIDEKIKETEALMKSFRLEESDRVSAAQTIETVKNDIRDFWREYRVYGGVTPASTPMPQGFLKAQMKQDLDLPEPPSIGDVPDNPASKRVLQGYYHEVSRIRQEMGQKAEAANAAVRKTLVDRLLPDILEGGEIGHELPRQMEKRLRNVQTGRGLERIVSERDALMRWEGEMKEKLEVLQTQVPQSSEWYESVQWAAENLGSFGENLELVNQDVVRMTNQQAVFKKSVVDLKRSLPTCNYPSQGDTAGAGEVLRLTNAVLKLMQERNDMVISLMQDNSGENMIYAEVQGEKQLLNMKAIVYKAMTNVRNVEKQVQDSIVNQATMVNQLTAAYDQWNRRRQVSAEMKKREDSLKEVNESLNCYDACTERLRSMQLIKEMIDKEVSLMCEEMYIQ